MDSTLRCNDLKCRVSVPDQAIVTTCSHIFCLGCANKLGLTNPVNGERICPACSTPLNNPDDAVCASLNPTEDYKTSILSGLNPNIIIECAGRGLAFWAYQMAQEITYQDYLARSLTERYTRHSEELNNAARKEKEANLRLQSQLSAAHAEIQKLGLRIQQTDQLLKDKTKVANQQAALYSKLKQQQLAGIVQYAADDDADALLMHASQQPHQHRSTSQRHPGGPQRHGRGDSNGSGSSAERRQQAVNPCPQAAQYHQSQAYGTGHNYRATTSQSVPVAPPTANRQRLPQPTQRNLPQPTFGSYNSTFAGASGRSTLASRQPHRSETPVQGRYMHHSQQQNVHNSPNGGFGMSAGMRVGRPSGGGGGIALNNGHAGPVGYHGIGGR